jgi:uncharacterized membrane protein
MTEYKKPGIVSALLLLTVLSALSAAFGLIMNAIWNTAHTLSLMTTVLTLAHSAILPTCSPNQPAYSLTLPVMTGLVV